MSHWLVPRCVRSRRFLLVLVAAAITGTPRRGPLAQSLAPDTPTPGLVGVVALFERAPIVALADAHRDATVAQFRTALVERPEFHVPGRDVVIEWGNSRYQHLLDRYVAGDSAPADSLRLIWRDAIGNLNGTFDSPVYEEFIVTVRDVNRTLPLDRRTRLLACDPPIDWTRVRARDDLIPFAAARDTFCANLIEREVLARRRSALVILGGGHLLRGATSDAPQPTANVTALLDQRHPGAVFVVTTRRSRDADELTRGWSEGSLLVLRGTALGRDATELGPFERIADAYLFFRPGRSVDADPAIYDGTPYRRELDRRWCIARGRPFSATISTRAAPPSTATCP
jgi:hypothetical protein